MATYMCDAGYDLVGGDALRTCDSDGNWSGIEPSNCQRKLVSLLYQLEIRILNYLDAMEDGCGWSRDW